MPDAEPTNPYAPPGAVPPRRSWAGSATLARVVAVVAGFGLLADPGAIPLVGSLVNGVPHGRLAARLIGFGSLLAAFLPWRADHRPDRSPEDL